MQEVIHRCDFDLKGKKCGKTVEEPTTFSVDNVSYTMDLCAQHKRDFDSAMQTYLTIAEPTTARSGKAVRQALKGKKGTFTTKDVRRWLLEQGREVSPTGRIPNALIEEYRVSQSA